MVGHRIKSLPGGGRSLRVLVADDNRDAADSMSLLVKMWGHEVRQTYDGAAALEMAAAYRPDVLLLDISMPKMDGCQLAKQLRRQTRFTETLLIAITGGRITHTIVWARRQALPTQAGRTFDLGRTVAASTRSPSGVARSVRLLASRK